MNILERDYYLKYCNNISIVTQTNCILYDFSNNEIYGDSFSEKCKLCGTKCNWKEYLTESAKECERWGGQYIFRCIRGLIFIAVALRNNFSKYTYGFINGPFLIGERKNAMALVFGSNSSEIESVPSITSKTAQSYADLWSFREYMSSTETNELKNVLDDFYSNSYSKKQIYNFDYIIEKENELIRSVFDGDKISSEKTVVELTGALDVLYGDDAEKLRARSEEILVLVSRIVINAGAESENVLKQNTHMLEHLQKCSTSEAISSWLVELVHLYINMCSNKNTKHKRIIKIITDYIHTHYTEKITLEDITDLVFLSRSYLCKILKEELNITFIDYINHIRIEKSMPLLQNIAVPISDVAYMVGFNDQSYFSKMFKKYTGVSPGVYRARSK